MNPFVTEETATIRSEQLRNQFLYKSYGQMKDEKEMKEDEIQGQIWIYNYRGKVKCFLIDNM